MKFGGGGPPKTGDVFKLYGEALGMVSRFCYFGIHMFRCGVSTMRPRETHLTDRIQKAELAIRTIPKPRELSLTTAIALFELKLSPIAT